MSREMLFSDSWQSGVALSNLPPQVAEATRREISAVQCSTCLDSECKHRGRTDRLPIDAGGKSQCLRWAKLVSRYSFRNGDGTVIIIPDEVIAAIKAEPVTEAEQDIYGLVMDELQSE